MLSLKAQRIIALVHSDLIPPDSLEGYSDQETLEFRTEFDVITTLSELGHEVRVLGISDDISPLRGASDEWRPDIVFNLLIEYQDVGAFQVHVASYFELLGLPYTGCNPRGLLLSRDKPLSKKILGYHRIPTPSFTVFPKTRAVRVPQRLRYPLIVKSTDEDASMGISQASIVHDAESLRQRVEFVHKNLDTAAIAESYIEGRELTIGVIGNQRLTTLPIWEMDFGDLPASSEPIATERIKWDLAYQERIGLTTERAKNIPGDLERSIHRLAKRVYRVLNLSGFARIDLRLSPDGKVYVIEANASPDIKEGEDFAVSAQSVGIEYPDLLERILRLGQSYSPPWE